MNGFTLYTIDLSKTFSQLFLNSIINFTVHCYTIVTLKLNKYNFSTVKSNEISVEEDKLYIKPVIHGSFSQLCN